MFLGKGQRIRCYIIKICAVWIPRRLGLSPSEHGRANNVLFSGFRTSWHARVDKTFRINSNKHRLADSEILPGFRESWHVRVHKGFLCINLVNARRWFYTLCCAVSIEFWSFVPFWIQRHSGTGLYFWPSACILKKKSTKLQGSTKHVGRGEKLRVRRLCFEWIILNRTWLWKDTSVVCLRIEV